MKKINVRKSRGKSEENRMPSERVANEGCLQSDALAKGQTSMHCLANWYCPSSVEYPNRQGNGNSCGEWVMWTQLAQFVRLQFVYMITIKLFLRLSWSPLVPPLHFFKYLLDLLACQMHTKLLRPCSIFVYIFSILSFTIFQPPYIFLVSFFLPFPYTYRLCWICCWQWKWAGGI